MILSHARLPVPPQAHNGIIHRLFIRISPSPANFLAPLALLEGAAKNFDAYPSGAPHRGGIFYVLRTVAGTTHLSLRGTAFHAVELLWLTLWFWRNPRETLVRQIRIGNCWPAALFTSPVPLSAMTGHAVFEFHFAANQLSIHLDGPCSLPEGGIVTSEKLNAMLYRISESDPTASAA
jgi:hypothetical protein